MDEQEVARAALDCKPEMIGHTGVISRMDDKYYFVSIIPQTACSGCYSKGICGVTGLNDKIITIPKKPSEEFKIGDQVTVMMKKSLGTKAVFLGYLLPFALLLLTLMLSYSFSKNEGIAGLSAIVVLVPYFFVLHLMRDRLKSTFNFSIR